MPSSSTNIPQPSPDSWADRHAVTAYIPASDYRYLARVFSGTKGCMSAVIANLLHSFAKQCQSENIEPQWNPENESRLIDILSRTNFRKPPARKSPAPRRADIPPTVPPV